MITCGRCNSKFVSMEDYQRHLYRKHKELLNDEAINELVREGIYPKEWEVKPKTRRKR